MQIIVNYTNCIGPVMMCGGSVLLVLGKKKTQHTSVLLVLGEIER